MKKFLPILLFVFALLAFAPAPAAAAPAVQEIPDLEQLVASVFAMVNALVVTLKSLGGVALLFAAVLNFGKQRGWIGDGAAPAFSLGLNVFALLVLAGLQIAGRADLVPVIDESAGILATILTGIVSLVFQLWVSRVGHEKVLAGMPMIGFSFSGRKAGESLSILEEIPPAGAE